MKSLFFRLYLLLLITFIGLGWSIDRLFDNYEQQSTVTTDLDIHKGTLFLLNRELNRQPQQQRHSYLAALSPSFGYPVQLVDAFHPQLPKNLGNETLSEQQQSYLQQGGIVTIFNDFSGKSWFLQKLSSDDQIIILGPVLNSASGQSDTIYTVILLTGLALIVFIWVWPISKGLMSLSKAAMAFGKGDFSVRAQDNVSAPLNQLVKRFNAMAERIQRLLKSHKDLSHAVSHELRTPIARIRFAMEMVRESKDEDGRNNYLDTMDENIEELDSLVDELLIYARFDREEPNLNLQQTDMVKVVNSVLAKFRQTDPQLRFTVSCKEEMAEQQCSIDAEAITRVLDNLVRNAVRYANTDINIELAIVDKQVKVNVNDDGPGIPEECWHNLFDPFVRLDSSRDRNSGGIGLGLAIVKRLIELHQGSVEIGTSELGGASFILQWPVQPKKN